MSAHSILATILSHAPLALLAKVTAVLATAACLSFVLVRASAAIRHLVWLGALASCVALALISPVAPRVPISMGRAAPVRVAPAAYAAPTVNTRSGITIRRTTRRTEVAVSPRRIFAGSIAARSEKPGWLATHGARTLIGLWLAGCLLVLGRCALGHMAVRRLVRRSHDVESLAWNQALETAARIAEVDGDVRILMSDEIAAPVTSGWLDPVILVPGDADEWSHDRRHVVLVHELAHISRLDYVAQLIATFATALFWFHPLVWLAMSRLRAEAEQAADDRVLASGTAAVTYAGHLLELARVESGLHLSAVVAVGMVKASRLEARFRAMFDNTRSRTAVSRRLQAGAGTLALAAMVPLAGVRAGRSPAPIRLPAPAAGSTVVDFGNAVAIVARPAAVISRRIADSTFELTADGLGAERLSLDLETGGSITIRGWDEPRIRVRARLSGQDWRDTDVRLTRSGSVVRLRSEFVGARDSRSTRHAFELWIPRRMNVDVKSAGGSLAINDVEGELRGSTGGGGITIEGVSGEARLSTGGGDVSVTNSSLAGSVSTGGGQVRISNAGTIRGFSGSGPVITSLDGLPAVATTSIKGVEPGSGVRVGRTARATDEVVTTVGSGGAYGSNRALTTTIRRNDDVLPLGPVGYSVRKAGGDITIEDVPTGASLTTGGGRIYVGSARGNLGATTGGGSITLPRVGGNVHASTGAGDVTITVVNTDGTEHTVDVFTGKGRVMLELPSDLDATFDLETAYTESHGATNIDSDSLSRAARLRDGTIPWARRASSSARAAAPATDAD